MLRLIYIYYGTLLPGWNTLRALSHGQRHFIVLWLKYWVIHALLQAFGVLTDFFAGGLPFYAALKLILSVGLWFSAPYSSNHLYNIIKKYVMGKLEPIVEQGFRWHATLDQDEQSSGPRVNKHLLKRELSNLMAEIEMDQAELHKREFFKESNLDRLDRDSMHNVIEYLTERLETQQPGDGKPYRPRRLSDRIN
ncbi:uncharacterized protein LOC108026571 isoform X1 [Drosophila biarmipes]|uniref:uncharacterized protein LOC108026571 isoform X1 n=1 Tax=Drosophila biarmipes TaxID=125945 RepID=UPI001CDB221C|nr:uncharacterized protein LOC108026571 isoform X1 [Drosophila biarmipes]